MIELFASNHIIIIHKHLFNEPLLLESKSFSYTQMRLL